MDEMMLFVDESTRAGETVKEILGKIRIGAAYMAELRGTYDETFPTYADLKKPEHKAFLVGMALAFASVKMFDIRDYMDGTATGSGTLDKIISDIQDNTRKYCMNEIQLSMDDALENLLTKEDGESSPDRKGGE